MDGALIVTVPSGGDLGGIADRMPAVLSAGQAARWADVDHASAETVADLLRPAPDGVFEAVPVSERVNRVDNDDPGLITPRGL